MAGVASESAACMNIPAEELEAALARMANVDGISFDGNNVTIRGGRLKATIQCIDGEPPDVPAMPSEWQPCPAGLLPALALAAPFCADDGWASGIRLMEGRITAINNASGVDVEVPALTLDVPAVLPQAAAAFLAACGAPAEYAVTEGALIFRWLDGRWLRCQMLVGAFPDMVDKILDSAGDVAPVAISPEWRNGYADASALSDGTITITPSTVSGTKGAGNGTVEIETAVPEGHRSHWATKRLDPVIACVQRWNPDAWPNVARFYGEGLRGVVIGVRR